jgi:hypothetical protein
LCLEGGPMYKEGMPLEEILEIKVPQERIDRVKKLVRFDIPGLSEEIKDFLISQQLQFVNIQYARFMAGVKFTQQDVTELLEGAIDCHAHGGSDPIDRLLLEDEIAIDYSRVRMRAVVFKTWYTPSASRIPLVKKYLDRWSQENGIRAVEIFGGVTLMLRLEGSTRMR